MREAELLKAIRDIFDSAAAKKSGLLVGNGDDGAIFSSAGKEVIVAADVAVEGIHFKGEWSSGFDIGRKITAANLADICAMGGWPHFLLVTVVLPDRWVGQALEIAKGIAHEAFLVDAAVIGGDLARGSELSISITAIGYGEKRLLRSSARVGDAVVISSIPGWSAAGLSMLKSGTKPVRDVEKRAVAEHKSPSIDYKKYRANVEYLNSAIDVSDGLVTDAGHLARASKVSIDIDSRSLVSAELASIGEAEDWIRNGGEDHVLLGTTSTPELCKGMVVIGRVTQNSDGKVLIDGKEVQEAGFHHQWNE